MLYGEMTCCLLAVYMVQVTRFDMLAGADVTWWGALGVDIENLLSGQPISESRLAGSYRDAILEV